MQIENTVKKDVFNMTVVKIDDLKRSIEGEMDDIQRHVRDQKDS